ncbi:hypothetical protein KIN20_005000 [Parelaphostrongylus tenuis]|uniref:Ribosome biogenesis protein NOP53 n=1 Tax=Parelaphostrongylus tenuis TaxID=148309 RepID=A0AAD5MKP7_PARTN|nr:hypothetical protein KIN20_005000 [Parelaphostrongylus tenuis]
MEDTRSKTVEEGFTNVIGSATDLSELDIVKVDFVTAQSKTSSAELVEPRFAVRRSVITGGITYLSTLTAVIHNSCPGCKMVAEQPTKAKKRSCRASRHKKKYWRKGVDVSNFEQTLHDKAYDTAADKPKEEISTVDCASSRDLSRFTKRQRAALEKISQSIGEPKQLPLPAPKFPSKKQPKLKQPVKRVEPMLFKQRDNYDLWEEDFVPKVNLEYEEAGEHLLRYTKKKLPNMPSTVRFKPSLLDAVKLPDAGASYNPKADDYQEYVAKIAVDEVNLIKEEERIQKATKPQVESIVTHEEKSLEETEGLVIDPRYDMDNSDMDIKEENDDEPTEFKGEKVVISDLMRKTRKQRQNAAKERKLLREQKRRKVIEKKQHDVYKAKKINKELAQKEALKEAERLERKKQKFLKKMTTRQQLGRGKFKDEEEPFLLQEELTDCLRLLKPQGHVLNDRMASLQRRNMLPIGGRREKNRLKSKLKRKIVKKRLTAEVTKGSRVI